MLARTVLFLLLITQITLGRTQGILDSIVWADDFRGNWNSIYNPEIETDERSNIIFGVTFLGDQDNFIEWRGDTIAKVDTLVGKRILFLAKIDPDGNLLWHLILAGVGAVNLLELKVDHDNNIIILLQASHSFDAFQQLFEPGYNLFKLDQDGDLLWSKQLQRASIPNAGHSLSIACNNDILLGGSIGKVLYDSVVFEIIGFDTIFDYLFRYDTLIIDGFKFAADTHNIFLTRLNSEGHVDWFKTFEHPGGLTLSAIDGSSPFAIALLGYYQHEDWTINNTLLPIDTFGYYHKFNMFILTVTEEGEIRWIKNYFNNALPTHLRYDYSGNLIVLGHFSTSTYYLLDTIQNLNNAGRLLLFKVDSIGNYLWGQNTGGNNTTYGGQLALNSSDEIYLAGRGLSNFLGRILYKYTPQGQVLWSIYPQPNGNRRSEDLAIDRSGHLILAGYYSGELHLGEFSFEYIGPSYCNYIVKFKSARDSITPDNCGLLTQAESVQGKIDALAISPNPANDKIRVNISSLLYPIDLYVYDIQGYLLLVQNLLDSANFEFDVSDWSMGTYIIRAETSISTTIGSFVVLH
jgi:hypothetical protein